MHKFWRSAKQCLFAGAALICLTVVSYRLHLNLATTGFLYVIVVVLLSRLGDFVSAIVASIVATLCLVYLAPPNSSFRVDDPLNVVAIAAFVVTSVTIARLVSLVRKQADDALSSVSRKVVEAEERERRRLAGELHEDIGQRLTLLSLEVERRKTDLPNPGTPSGMDPLQKEILEILTDVKALAHELYSPRLDYLGIAAVMSSFCQEFGERKNVMIDFTSDGLPSFIPPEIALCLFRVLQETLHNAVQHSGTRQFDAKLWSTLDEIHLRVTDCGVGFNFEKATKAGGLGLNRMQERLKLVKGKISIDSPPLGGTTVHARVPVGFGTDSIQVVG
jgi:signal transduction histidine kinase